MTRIGNNRGLSHWVIAWALLCSVACGADLPSMDDLNTQFAEKHYREALSGIARALALSPDRATAYDRYQLLMLRGECEIQLKEIGVAQQAFKLAADEATDPVKFNRAKGSLLLCTRAATGKYITRHSADKTAKAAPIGIIDEVERAGAFNALMEDELFEAQPKIKKAQTTRKIADVIEALSAVAGANAAEMAGTERDKETQPILKEMSDLANELVGKELKRLNSSAQSNWSEANTWIRYVSATSGETLSIEKKGLTSAMQTSLRDGMDLCKKIAPITQTLAGMFGKKVHGDFSDMPAECERIYKNLNQVLTHEYAKDVYKGKTQ